MWVLLCAGLLVFKLNTGLNWPPTQQTNAPKDSKTFMMYVGGGQCCRHRSPQQRLQLQEVWVPKEVLRVLPSRHLLRRQLQVY